MVWMAYLQRLNQGYMKCIVHGDSIGALTSPRTSTLMNTHHINSPGGCMIAQLQLCSTHRTRCPGVWPAAWDTLPATTSIPADPPPAASRTQTAAFLPTQWALVRPLEWRIVRGKKGEW